MITRWGAITHLYREVHDGLLVGHRVGQQDEIRRRERNPREAHL
jgi:hypothetical protein